MIFSIFIIIFFSTTFINHSNTSNNSNNIDNLNNNSLTQSNIKSSNSFFWPLPGTTRISSYFGKRTSPTAFASSYHKGIDIPATPGTNIYAAMSGTVITAAFSGSGGCTVSIKNR